MTLSDLASIGSFVSGVAVMISLVYVALQVGQAKKNQRASIHAARTDRIVNVFMGSTEPSLADAIARGASGDLELSDTQLRQFTNYSWARFFNAEDSFFQFRDGLLHKSAFDSIVRGLKFTVASPGTRALFKRMRPMFRAEFVEFVDGILAETPAELRSDMAAQWRSDVRSELESIAAAVRQQHLKSKPLVPGATQDEL
jgi:hypothetical protein